MSSSESLKSKLDALECHFTWDLNPKEARLIGLREKLEDIGTEEGNCWLGHIYNLQGFIQYKLDLPEEALRFFCKATEAFQQLKTTNEGPWLVVNYGNLAWVHHQLGDDEKSQDFLSKVDALMNKYPPLIEGEPHPEIYAEKAWTLMKFNKEKKLLAADYFQKACRMQPDMVQWHTSRVLAFASAYKFKDTDLEADILEDLRVARQEDPENLYLAAVELKLSAKRGDEIRDEAQELAEKILLNPASSYSGLKPLLRAYRQIDALDEAIDLAERALRKQPDSRYLKRCAALCYKWKIIFSRDNRPNQRMINRAISLYEEVISLYPNSLIKKIDLTNIQAKSADGLMIADQKYQEMLDTVQDPEDRQMLYNQYAKYLNYDRKQSNNSVRYHMRAAAINEQTFFRHSSIKILQNIRDRGRNRMCREIHEFLENLGDVEPL